MRLGRPSDACSRGFLAGIVAIGVAVLGAGTSASAQAPSEPAPVVEEAGSARATEFRAVTGPVQEDVPGGPLLVGAYAIAWVAVFGFVFRLVRMQASTRSELERLRRAVDAARPEPR